MTTPAVGARVATYDPTTSVPPEKSAAGRIESIDFVRGLAMILMAIDHVRVYAGVPAGGPAPGVFFTRWITHFVAPAFVFLAGTSAFLHGRKLGDPAALSRYLLVRGAILVALELTVIRVAWTFNLDFANYLLAGVIWAIGWSMILMAALVRLPAWGIGAIGLVMIAGHNALDPVMGRIIDAASTGALGWLWKILYVGFFAGPVRLGESGPPLIVLYSIVPWIGVMAAGYAFGTIVTAEGVERRRNLWRLGLGAIALFLVLRGTNLYGDPNPWSGPGDENPMPAILSFLNTTKYPASLSFLLMTLGPMFILLAVAERWRGGVVEATKTFGRVPMFYYLLHIPVIHLAAVIVSLVREGSVNRWLFANHPMNPPPVPEGYTWSLGLLYLVFAICVVALYFPCRWYARERASRRHAWTSYL